MAMPVYVVTGFLEAGKTTFLNHLLNRSDWRDVRLLLIQFETGEEEFQSRYDNCDTITFPKATLEQHSLQIVEQIHNYIQCHEIDEIWVEWNGMVPFSQLQALLLHPLLRGLCKIQKVMHVADAASIELLLGRTGGALPEQIANSDFVVVRNLRSAADYRRIRRLIRGINPGVDVYETDRDLHKLFFREKAHPVNMFFLIVVILVVLLVFFKPVLELLQIPVNTIINIFSGIILQAIPFLLIGVLLSSAMQVFVPQSAIERRFPKSLGMGMLVAVLGGFLPPGLRLRFHPYF